ncbi:hypothetical protein [Endozoicomonas lisbonensis]|uniref:Initiator Rep protein domain-containing protein n=1 Tax=Endozoicomonas lisbonensis TaxID=3120522 RepID=A0ABV2SAW2_9GAMM
MALVSELIPKAIDSSASAGSLTLEYQRNTRSGVVAQLSRIHIPEKGALSKKAAEELAASRKASTVHTERVMEQIITQLVVFFKTPAAQQLDLDKPDTSMVIDLDSTTLQPRPKSLGKNMDIGWIYRLSVESTAAMIGYNRQKLKNIKLELQIYNLLKVIQYVWVSLDENLKVMPPTRMDIFMQPNFLDDQNAFFFNINKAWVNELLLSDNAYMLYHEELTKKLTSTPRIKLAVFLLGLFDLEALSDPDRVGEIQNTPLEKQSGLLHALYNGEKEQPDWNEFKHTSIIKPLPFVKKALQMSHLEFHTNGKKGDAMDCWFAYAVNRATPYPATYESRVPQLALNLDNDAREARQPAAVSSGVLSPNALPDSLHSSLNNSLNREEAEDDEFSPSTKYAWQDISTRQRFVADLSKLLESLGLGLTTGEVISAYTGKASRQIPKSLKAWLYPIRRWLTGNKSPFGPSGETAVASVAERINEPSGTVKTPPQANAKKAIRSCKVPLSRALIDESTVKKAVTQALAANPDFEQYEGETEDFAVWTISFFIDHHDNACSEPQTPARWKGLFCGYVKNRILMDDMVYAFRAQEFQLNMITDTSPFREEITKLTDIEEKILLRTLALFKIENAEKRLTVTQWYRKAWNWVVIDELLPQDKLTDFYGIRAVRK